MDIESIIHDDDDHDDDDDDDGGVGHTLGSHN